MKDVSAVPAPPRSSCLMAFSAPGDADKLTGLDFRNPDDRLQISIGARIYQLLESKR